MFEINYLDRLDFYEFAHRAVEANIRPYLENLDLDALQTGSGFIGLLDGEPVGCAGVVPVYGENSIRATAWAILTPEAKPVFMRIHCAARQYLWNCAYQRIEAFTDAGFSQANRWCELLGFKLVAERLLSYFPNGASANYWAMVKD